MAGRSVARIALTFLAALPAFANAVSIDLRITNAFGPLTEIGETRAAVVPILQTSEPDVHLQCETPRVARRGDVFTIDARLAAGAPSTDYVECEHVARASLGVLAPGVYTATANVAAADGRSASVATTSFTVAERGAKCNVDPQFNTIAFTLAQKSLADFETSLQDAAYRARFGDVVYLGRSPYPRLAHPELLDPVRVMDRLMKTGEFASVAPGDGVLCFAPSPPDATAPAVEYYNPRLDHYFVTAYPHEQAAIASGAVGADWVRTGESFSVIVQPGCPQSTEGRFHPAYRFTGVPNRGPASHFFTVDQSECAVVRDRVEWGWQYEGIPFWALEPVAGACAFGTPLRRAYNNGIGGAPNHRYTVKPVIIAEMVARGWVDEGVAMCVNGP